MSWAAQVRKLWLVQCALWCWAIGDRESPDFEHFDLFFWGKTQRTTEKSSVICPKTENRNREHRLHDVVVFLQWVALGHLCWVRLLEGRIGQGYKPAGN